MIAGGFDDISEEGSMEFANMKATSNAETEFAMGREPTEMSRPTTTTRSGVSINDAVIILSTDHRFLVHGSPRYWCAHCHEREDCTCNRCPHSWYPCIHFNVHVSVTFAWIGKPNSHQLQ